MILEVGLLLWMHFEFKMIYLLLMHVKDLNSCDFHFPKLYIKAFLNPFRRGISYSFLWDSVS